MSLKTANVQIMIVAAGVMLGGCNTSTGAPTWGQPAKLPSAPVEPVNTGQLPPPSNNVPNSQVAAVDPQRQQPAAPVAPTIATPEPQVSEALPPSGEPVSREGVSGSWNVNTDNPDCRMILAFTKWSGGYRAATSKCLSSELTGVDAWDVRDQQVVLFDGSGNTIARLYKSGAERYDGTTNSGKPVSFTR